MKTAVVIIAGATRGALAGGCATSAQTDEPDGKVAPSINCSGTALTLGNCYEKAGQICGAQGYVILAGGAEQGAALTATPSVAVGGTTMSRSMTIRCKD
jgi:hypothetical protein